VNKKQKIKIRALLPVLALLILTLSAACDHTLGYTREIPDRYYTVRVASAVNGSVKAVPAGGIAGTQVVLAVNPQPGYLL
jgi:hypothetical protein